MTRDCWQDFVLSGKISDYLQYKRQEAETNGAGTFQMEGKAGGSEEGLTAGGRHGAEVDSDRHGLIGHAGGGI